jgi:hypothetical protein
VSEQLTIGAAPLSAGEARALTDEVKADAAALWRKLLRLYEGAAHTALGYASWADYCRAEFDMGRSRAYQLLDAGRVVAVIEDQSTMVDSLNERQARELASLLDDPERLRELVQAVVDEDGNLPTAEWLHVAVAERRRREDNMLAQKSSTGVEWYTPAAYIEAARTVLGGIDLDPASCEQANATVRATTYYDIRDDGLEQPWYGRVWLNPPYSEWAKRFVEKLLVELAAGRVDAAVVLLNVEAVCNRWFLPMWGHVLCFLASRIKFASPDRESVAPMNGSVFIYLGPDPDRFADVFGRFDGTIAVQRPCGCVRRERAARGFVASEDALR